MSRKRISAPQGLIYTALIIYSAIIGLPLLWLVSSSFKTMRELFDSPFDLPKDPQWANFESAWESGISDYLLNSVIVTGGSVFVIAIVSGMAAYALARLHFIGRVPVYLLLIAGFAVPIHTTLVPLYRGLNWAGLVNTFPGLMGPYIAFGIPFSVLLLYAFFAEFPGEIEDAARIDGCNTRQMLFKIVLPLSIPGLSSVAIFQTVFLWNEFALALIIISEDALRTIPLGLTKFQGQWTTNWPALLAAVTLSSLPMLIIYLVLQKQFLNTLSGFSK